MEINKVFIYLLTNLPIYLCRNEFCFAVTRLLVSHYQEI